MIEKPLDAFLECRDRTCIVLNLRIARPIPHVSALVPPGPWTDGPGPGVRPAGRLGPRGRSDQDRAQGSGFPDGARHTPGAPGVHVAGEPNILEPQPKLAVWSLVVFVVLLLVLWKFAWGPLAIVLHQREEHLERCLLDTERARNESEQLLAEHRRLLAQASDEVRGIIEEAKRDAMVTADDIMKKAQAEAESSRQRAEREIATARDQALVELWKTAANLAVSVAGKVLVKDLTPDDQRRLFETAVASLPATPTSANGHGGRHA